MRYDALGEDVDGNMGLKTKAYMEGRAKLLESGGKVVRQTTTKAAGGFNKWQAKADSKGYNGASDFVDGGSKRTRTE